MPISTRDLSQLPSIDRLEKLAQSIAMLDAIVSPDWEYRYFSFNAAWDTSLKERMASMRNGSGNEYFLIFSPHGAILKGFDHEAPMSPWKREPVAVWPGVLDSVPDAFASFLAEPAFSMGDCTFCIWREPSDEHWQHGPVTFPESDTDDPDGSKGCCACSTPSRKLTSILRQSISRRHWTSASSKRYTLTRHLHRS